MTYIDFDKQLLTKLLQGKNGMKLSSFLYTIR